MNTPICDFARRYAESGALRLHMPGHKGQPLLGAEPLDITEIPGADVLYHAEGIILENMKFCEYWGYERAQAAQWMQEGFALPDTLPVCQIERDYTVAAAGQLRTRFQAFVESLEIKHIQAETRERGSAICGKEK